MASSSRAAAEDKNEPAWPLAIPYPSVHPAASDVDEAAQTATGWRSVQYLRKRRCLLCCCGCCVLAVVIVGLVVLVLALTVLKVKDPRLTMNGVSLAALSTGAGSGSGLAVNATVTADVSVKNPNVASFRFSQSATEVYYRGQTVSVAYVPAGRVGARRTVRMNMTVDVLGDRFARVLNGTGGLVLGQEYDLTTYTEMNGTVRVLGVYERELQIRMNCSIIMEVGGAAGDMMGSGTPTGVQSKGASCVARVS